jgi:predicted nucleic-acid-binding protein
MIAVDTNIVVRFLVRDDETQATLAASLIHTNEIWVAKTVLLETEWVLRRLYGFTPENVDGGFRTLAGMSTVFLEDEAAVAKALDWFAQGLDFADALHLASAGSAKRFATFDQKLVKRAGRLTGLEMASI